MPVFYVRKTGSDAAAGTSPATAWLTLGKCLGAAGIASGDTVYIGAGTYREVVTVAMTSATATTSVIGDVTGAFTGDAGEVIWTAHLTNDYTAPSASPCLTLSARDFLSFSNITFYGGSGAGGCVSAGSGSTDITFTNCLLNNGYNYAAGVSVTNAAGVNGNWLFDRCIIMGVTTVMQFNLTQHTADYDANLTVRNCILMNRSGQTVSIAAVGASTNYGGGVDVINCTLYASIGMRATSAGTLSLTYPCTCYSSILIGDYGIWAATSGQIVEDYNVINCPLGARTNVAVGAHSAASVQQKIELGQAFMYGGVMRQMWAPTVNSPLIGFGAQAGGPSVDLRNRTRPAPLIASASGTATAGANLTLTDSGKTWGVNAWAGYTVRITGGTGSGQVKQINSNTATVLTVAGNWKTNPSTDSTYTIYWGMPATTGTATAGSTTTLTDSNAAWGASQWIGYTLTIDSGTGSGQTLTITANTATQLTFAAATAPDATSTYSLFRQTNTTTQNNAVGALEYAEPETTSAGVKTHPGMSGGINA